MKALTIWQPWASLIMAGVKPFEFRRWDYGSRYRGLEGQRIVIHAGSRKVVPDEIDDLIRRLELHGGEGTGLKPDALPILRGLQGIMACRGVLTAAGLGTVVLGRARRCTDLFKGSVADSDRIDQHMWAWPVSDPVFFSEPFPRGGAQGFWNWGD